MWGDSCSEGSGFESQHCILDGHISYLFVVKIVIVCLKRRKNEKETVDGPLKKYFFKWARMSPLFLIIYHRELFKIALSGHTELSSKKVTMWKNRSSKSFISVYIITEIKENAKAFEVYLSNATIYSKKRWADILPLPLMASFTLYLSFQGGSHSSVNPSGGPGFESWALHLGTLWRRTLCNLFD